MKKTLLLLTVLVLSLALALSACGADTTEDPNTDPSQQEQTGDEQDAQDVNEENPQDTEDDLAYIQDKGELIIGVTNYEPMNYLDENGEWTGFDTEFAQAVCEKLGVTAVFQEIDWDNKILELDSKSIDCVWNGMTLTDEVLNAMSCSQPYINNAQVVVMPADEIENYNEVELLSALSFAAEAGSAGEAALQENNLTSAYTAVSTQADALLEVASGASDACVIDITMAVAMTGEGTNYADLTYGLELTSEEYGIGFRKGSSAVAAVDEIINQLIEEGTLQALAEKYDLSGALVANQ